MLFHRILWPDKNSPLLGKGPWSRTYKIKRKHDKKEYAAKIAIESIEKSGPIDNRNYKKLFKMI